MGERLPPGVYERLVTSSVEAALARLDAARLRADVHPVGDEADLFARRVFDEVSRALASLGGADAASKRAELTNLLLDFLRERVALPDDEPPAVPPRVLHAVYGDQPPPRTRMPLASSSLLEHHVVVPAPHPRGALPRVRNARRVARRGGCAHPAHSPDAPRT